MYRRASSEHQMTSQQLSLISVFAPVLLAYRSAKGFEQRDLMATLRPLPRSSNGRGDLLRAIQVEENGMYFLLRLRDSREKDWVRKCRQLLWHAGYREKGRVPDEIAMTRWLFDRRDLQRELSFFSSLEDSEDMSALPRRAPRQSARRSRRRNLRDWMSIVETIRESQLKLDSCAISFHRKGLLRGGGGVSFEVRAVALRNVGRSLAIHLLVSLFSKSSFASRTMRALEAAGYERSAYSRVFCATRAFHVTRQAVRESERVFAALAE
jgi:hypothetical protein